MEITRFVVGPMQVNSYLVDAGGEAAPWFVVDPGYPENDLLESARRRSDRPGIVLLTHAHFDHVGGLRALVGCAPGIQGVWVRAADRAWIADPSNAWPPDYPALAREVVEEVAWHDLPDDGAVDLNGVRFRILSAPGHTPGGAILWHEQEGWAFTGDTIFRGSVGRVDLPGGSALDLVRTLREQLALMPDTTRLLPGHGPETTLGLEKSTNPYLLDPGALLGGNA
jgi:glyoxylase-like metal-dependent hydrolase (beta-lactamase superfamily II)